MLRRSFLQKALAAIGITVAPKQLLGDSRPLDNPVSFAATAKRSGDGFVPDVVRLTVCDPLRTHEMVIQLSPDDVLSTRMLADDLSIMSDMYGGVFIEAEPAAQNEQLRSTAIDSHGREIRIGQKSSGYQSGEKRGVRSIQDHLPAGD